MKALLDISTKNVFLVEDGTKPAKGQMLVPIHHDVPPHDPLAVELVATAPKFDGSKAVINYSLRSLSPAESFAKRLARGSFSDPVTGVRLKITESAQNKFTQEYMLLSADLASGLVQPTDLRAFYDFNDEPRQLAAADLQALLLRYGRYCREVFIAHAP